MRSFWVLFALALALVGLPVQQLFATDLAPASSVVIAEISYNPPAKLGADEKYEFVEIHNRGSSVVDVSGWRLKDRDDVHAFHLPPGTLLAVGENLVLARDAAAIQSAHGAEVRVLGGVSFALGNDGDTVRLMDANGLLVDQVTYMDRRPWPGAADGEGSTLERIALADDSTDFTNFAASSPAVAPGTPGQRNSQAGTIPSRHAIVINEIQYNPVKEPDVDDLRHCPGEEFLELHNRSALPVDLSGWSFEQGISFVIPPGIALEPGGFLVIWANRAEFDAKYGQRANAVGPFAAELDDGGEEILLVDATGAPVDYVDFNDVDPWPVQPDGLRGSLELVDPRTDNDRGRAWRESSDFRGTPGAENSASLELKAAGNNDGPSITQVRHSAELDRGRDEIRSSDSVRIEARVLDRQGVKSVVCEYQVLLAGAYIRKSDSRFATDWVVAAMSHDAERSIHAVVLPPQPHRTLVRYRVRAVDAAAAPAVSFSPRTEDPEPNWAYFVHDGVPAYVASERSAFGQPGVVHEGLDKVPVYHLIADGADIEEAQYKILPESEDRTWEITLVHDGHVHDHVGLQLRSGHRYSWPKRPWKIGFNRGNLFDGRFENGEPYPRKRKKVHFMSAQHDAGKPRGESGVFESLAWKLFREADVIGAQTTFVQLRFVRSPEEHHQFLGDFFGIFLETQRIDTTALEDNGRPTDQGSSLYKFSNGPVKVHPDCSLSRTDVETFLAAYNRPQTREWFEQTLDVPRYLSFRVVVELSDNHDMDSLKNFYYYRSSTTGLWEVLPWDLDNTFGAEASGDEPLKTRVLPLFPLEYRNRFRFLWQVLYDERRMFGIIDDWSELIQELADADLDRWDTEPRAACPRWPQTGGECKRYLPFRTRMRELKTWIRNQSRLVQASFRDALVPAAPGNQEPPAGWSSAVPVKLQTLPFSDPDAGDTHARTRWIVIAAGGDWARPLWDVETADSLTAITLPFQQLEIGARYWFRASHTDSSGRTSLLSQPTEFVAGVPDATPPSTPPAPRLVSVDARRVVIAWDVATDELSGVFGYRVERDGALATTEPVVLPRFVDFRVTPGGLHSYRILAVNGAGLASPLSSELRVEVPPLRALGGWALPADGLEYLYDARPREDAFGPTREAVASLDGTWARSRLDDWDGSTPGRREGAPGGVHILSVLDPDRDHTVSVLGLEDAGSAAIVAPPPSNQRLIFLHAAGDGDLLDSGVTVVARWRISPQPQDLAGPRGQALDAQSPRGQIGLAQRTASGDRSASVWLDGAKLFAEGRAVEVEATAFQSVWMTIQAEAGQHRVRVYLNGSPQPALDFLQSLPAAGGEDAFGGNHLFLGLPNRAESGAIEVDYLGFQRGAHSPRPSEEGSRPFRRGDVDANGKVELTDAGQILGHLFRGDAALSCLDAADTDDSGGVQITDAIYLLRHLFQGGPEPAWPYPSCALDPTPDLLGVCAGEGC